MKIIFVVEDDENIQNVIKIALTNSGYEVRLFGDATSFFSSASEITPDMVLLDIMLPKTDGISILKKIKHDFLTKSIPVMMISAKNSEIDKVVALDLGADDYLSKPFGVLELISRVKALFRRTPASSRDSLLSVGGIVLDINEFICTYNDIQIPFTQKEFQLLKLLMQNQGKVLHREDILNAVWGYDFVGETRTLDVHIAEIRSKLSSAGLTQEVIQTVRGVGYKLVL